MRRGHEDLKRFEFVLGFSMARAAVYDIRNLPCTPDFERLTGLRTLRS